MATVTVAAKAPFIAYSAIIAAEFVNSTTDKAITVEFVDDKSVEAGKDATVKYAAHDKAVYGDIEVLNELTSLSPSINAVSDFTWVNFAFEKLANKNFKALATDLEKLDAHLNFRSFIVGHSISVADVAVWGVLRANAVMGSVLKNEVYTNISRWYNFIGSDSRFDSVAEKTTKSINDLRKSVKAASGAKKETHKANFEIDLPNAKVGEVVTRFPPEPSGYLHIGHAKAAILNEYFAHAYKGKLIIRFDDTNPTKERVEFQDSIIEDLALLGIKGDKITYSSDYFDKMYELAVQLIKEGKAYCDDTPQEKMREERMVGDASARRDRSVEENLKIFTEEMKNGTEEGLKNCLRAKIDYKALNKALRDPVIYRCNLSPHHRTGTQWKVYPTYDFCVPIVDSIEGVTHALRTNVFS
ncbi:glutamate--tRNA ligase [Candidozyma auris]